VGGGGGTRSQGRDGGGGGLRGGVWKDISSSEVKIKNWRFK
jgi:hypothetical protein